MLANPGGTFMYTVWNQWKEEILPEDTSWSPTRISGSAA